MKRMWQGKIFKPLMQTVTVGVFVVLPLASSPDTPSKLAAENWRRKYTCRCAFSGHICPGGTLYPADPRSALFLLVGLHVAWVTWVGWKAPSNDPTHVLQPSVYPEKTLDPSISLPYCKKPLSLFICLIALNARIVRNVVALLKASLPCQMEFGLELVNLPTTASQSRLPPARWVKPQRNSTRRTRPLQEWLHSQSTWARGCQSANINWAKWPPRPYKTA